MFGWLAASSLLAAQSIWVVPNLLGSTLYGHPVLQRGFGSTTVSGLGLHFVVAGLIGLLFGLAVGDSRNRMRVVLLGVASGLFWYYFSQALFWRKLGALVLVYSPPRQMLLGHLLFGLVLGWFPSRLRSLRGHWIGDIAAPAKTLETAAPPDAVE